MTKSLSLKIGTISGFNTLKLSSTRAKPGMESGFKNILFGKSTACDRCYYQCLLTGFHPCKKKGYSLGIVSCSVLNMSCEARGSGFSVWPLAILEGPTQMHSTYVPLRKLCQTFESFYNNGIRVHDALTNSFQTIHGVVAQVIGDSPALAKIGMHNSHSSYFGCHRCGHKGVVWLRLRRTCAVSF